jgi:hypothetical protein
LLRHGSGRLLLLLLLQCWPLHGRLSGWVTPPDPELLWLSSSNILHHCLQNTLCMLLLLLPLLHALLLPRFLVPEQACNPCQLLLLQVLLQLPLLP